LSSACRQHAAWALAGYPELKIAVNMSARQFFDPNLLDDLAVILAETRMEAGLLELEISEGILLRDMDKATAILARLRAAGVGIALDDFGCAYSALSALKVFPIDVVKVARAYVRDDAAAPCDRALTVAVIAMGKTISPTVVAQGVETREQAEFIRQSECDEFQGFYLGVPMPAAQVEAHLGGYVRQRTEARGGGE